MSGPHHQLHIGHLLRIPFQALVGSVLERVHADGFEDVRAAHLPVFQHIRRDGSRLTELARLAQVTPQSMSYLVDQLATRGYVERTPDPDDARAVRIRLTARGWDEAASARRAIDDLEAEWIAVLGPGRYREMTGALGEIAGRLATRGYG